MFMDPPITHPLTILIRQSTRTSECQLVPYTGSIAGHICVLAGGGEDAVGVLSLALQRRGLFMLKEVGGRKLGASSSQRCPIRLKIRQGARSVLRRTFRRVWVT